MGEGEGEREGRRKREEEEATRPSLAIDGRCVCACRVLPLDLPGPRRRDLPFRAREYLDQHGTGYGNTQVPGGLIKNSNFRLMSRGCCWLMPDSA